MKRQDQGPSPRKVDDLKDKARREANLGQPTSGKNVNDILYGPLNENGPAAGKGEFVN